MICEVRYRRRGPGSDSMMLPEGAHNECLDDVMIERQEDVERHRRRLLGVAYRMLGSWADAEDVVQEAYLRWHQAGTAQVRSSEAWLVTVVTRLSIDRRCAAEREHYPGPWLPDPVGEREAWSIDPERRAELASDLSMAFLAILERLGPEERAAFLLREVFGHEYDEIAVILGKSRDACRQIVHRAKERVRRDRPRSHVSVEVRTRLTKGRSTPWNLDSTTLAPHRRRRCTP